MIGEVSVVVVYLAANAAAVDAGAWAGAWLTAVIGISPSAFNKACPAGLSV